jgi:hypothetical protein
MNRMNPVEGVALSSNSYYDILSGFVCVRYCQPYNIGIL